jgi:putative flavoprotein involved in K+ transport
VDERLAALVVGGGPAGLAASRALAEREVEHVVLEAGRVGATWRAQRWDSFRLNTPRWLSRAPDAPAGSGDRHGFAPRDEVIAWLEDEVERHRLPVRTGVRVLAAEPSPPGWTVRTPEGALRAGALVVASGFQRVPRTPAAAARLPVEVTQVHAADYRHPGELPPGAVLVVGSAQTGVQITEDLMAAGRRVYLATSRVGRLPRRHRGRDTMAWWHDLGVLDVRPHDVTAAVRRAAQPQVSGTRGGRTVALQQLAREGVTLLGRFRDVDDGRAILGDDLLDNVRFADEAAERHRVAIDERIAAAGLDAQPAEPDPVEAPEPGLDHGPRAIHLREAGIASVVWATGFGADLGWLRASQGAGLHLIGAPWLHRRASGILWGFPGDAARVAREVVAASAPRTARTLR